MQAAVWQPLRPGSGDAFVERGPMMRKGQRPRCCPNPNDAYFWGVGELAGAEGTAKGAVVDGAAVDGAAAGRVGLTEAAGLGDAVVAAGTVSRMVP